jgi:hypothetical protein
LGFFEGADEGGAVLARGADYGSDGFLVEVYRAEDLQAGGWWDQVAEAGDEVVDGLGGAGQFG